MIFKVIGSPPCLNFKSRFLSLDQVPWPCVVGYDHFQINFNEGQMATKFSAAPVSPWNFFLCQFQPTKLLTCVMWTPWLLWLTLRISHRRGNQELPSWNPQRPIRGLWHGCQNTDRLFNQRAQQHARTHTHACCVVMNPHTHKYTHIPMHTNSQWQIVLLMQFWLTSILMGILQESYMLSKTQQCGTAGYFVTLIINFFFLCFFFVCVCFFFVAIHKIWFVLVVPVYNKLKCFQNIKTNVKLYNDSWLKLYK